MALTQFFGHDNTRNLYQHLYDITIDCIRASSPKETCWYAPPLSVKFPDEPNDELYVVPSLAEDEVVSFIKKPWAIDGDVIFYHSLSRDQTTIQGQIIIILESAPRGWDGALQDIFLILRYGIRKLEDDIKAKTDLIKGIANFKITIERVVFSCDPREAEKALLRVIFLVTIRRTS